MLNIFKTEDEVLAALAAHFVTTANQAITARGRFAVALSGGSSPKKLYQLLAASYRDQVPWNNVYFFFGDERNVPDTDKDSNYRMVKNALFDPLQINPAQIFPVDTSELPGAAANVYQKGLSVFFGHVSLRFDLVLLGLGDNSHTASLFPFTAVLLDSVPAVSEVFVKELGVYRITFNAPLINEARSIAFLVYGANKAAAVHHVLAEAGNVQLYPAQLIKPVKGEITWFLDSAAAADLDTDQPFKKVINL